MGNVIALTEKKSAARVDSLAIAESLGVSHKAVLQLIDSKKLTFEEFGKLPFEMGVKSSTEVSTLFRTQG